VVLNESLDALLTWSIWRYSRLISAEGGNNDVRDRARRIGFGAYPFFSRALLLLPLAVWIFATQGNRLQPFRESRDCAHPAAPLGRLSSIVATALGRSISLVEPFGHRRV